MSEIDSKSDILKLEEKARLCWPEVINVVKKSDYIYFSVKAANTTSVTYNVGVTIIDTEILPFILDFLREKSIQITWMITGRTFDVEYFNAGNEIPKILLNYVRNGDNLRIELFADFHRTIENILETFKSMRFSEIRIDIARNDEDLQFILDATHAKIYYAENMEWVLFEPTNLNEF